MTFTATTALPYEHLDRATAGLRAELRRQLLAADVHEVPKWDTFRVTGPNEFTDLRGHTYYEYRATVESQRPFDAKWALQRPGGVPKRPTKRHRAAGRAPVMRRAPLGRGGR